MKAIARSVSATRVEGMVPATIPQKMQFSLIRPGYTLRSLNLPDTRSPMPDDLLRPTVGAGVNMSARPWRLMSQTYVAFFGGVIASTVVAYLNAGRLGVDAAKRRLILLSGLAGLVVVVGVFLLLYSDAGVLSGLRVGIRVVAVLCCMAQIRWQRPMDRAFQLRGAEYGSLWGLGIAATVGGAIIEALILLLVTVVL
ncbi:hypothetical protein GCM10009742_54970 [Kribbella karoonensis]|uniref:Uncharacterized protein n=2 Tax=Kribbellaceae TaxID=2726069 RepID=A0ABP4Q7C7_9ACTN